MHDTLNRLRNLSTCHPQGRLIQSELDVLRKMRDFVFFMEFLINDGVCFIYKGNSTPGRSSKNSLSEREFSTLDLCHVNVMRHDVDNPLSCTAVRPRDLTYRESKMVKCCMDHDRMLLNGYDHQFSSLDGCQIDKFEFLHTCRNDDSTMDWAIKSDLNGSLMAGGLRSLCLNSRYFVDCVDQVGRVLHSFDGVFEFERGKEFFCLEYTIRQLETSDNGLHDIMKKCRRSKLIARMRNLLDDFERAHALPRINR